MKTILIIKSSRDIGKLAENFGKVMREVQLLVNEVGKSQLLPYSIKPFFTLRSLQDQARLWRQSRSSEEIQEAIKRLEKEGATYLSFILNSVGPQYGRWATNALPGQSWHQWGFAADFFVLNDQNKAVWSANHVGYKNLAELSKKAGLVPGFLWKHRDAVHVQYHKGTVRSMYTWEEINDNMCIYTNNNTFHAHKTAVSTR